MYQNRNAIVSNVMGGESVHAAIERKLRNIPIYLPSDILEASQLEKYEVKQLSLDFVKDYAEKSTLMYDNIRPGKKTGDPTVNDISH